MVSSPPVAVYDACVFLQAAASLAISHKLDKQDVLHYIGF